MPNFKIEQNLKDNCLQLTLSGVLNEDAKLPVLEFANASQITFDIGKVTAINSIGIRNWMMWLSKVPKTMPLKIKVLPKCFVDQANVIAGFLPSHTEYESIEVPYFCDDCDKAHSIIIDSKKYNSAKTLSETSTCPKCGKESHLNIIKNTYFRFLQR